MTHMTRSVFSPSVQICDEVAFPSAWVRHEPGGADIP